MITRKTVNPDVAELAEKHFVEAYANLNECVCKDEHNLHVALSEQRSTTPYKIFSPDHVGIKKAYCATFDRRC